MNYWITVQWPSHEENDYYCVWLQEGKESVAEDMHVGDFVFKYESAGEPQEIGQRKRKIGKKGIFALMKIEEKMDPKPYREEYEDRHDTFWAKIADASPEQIDGFVPLIEVNRILGYSPKYSMRGFGDRSSGLKKISKQQFDEILKMFLHSTVR